MDPKSLENVLEQRRAALRQRVHAGRMWGLTPRKMGPREEWQQLFRANGLVAPAPAVETRSVSAMRSLVARSGFLSWLPDALLTAAGTAEAIRPLMIEGRMCRARSPFIAVATAFCRRRRPN